MTKTIATHSGTFHADDAFAVGTLLMLHPEATVIRSRNEEVIKNADIVVDVGGIYDPEHFRFDHHQTGGAGKHDNGIPYASFGLVWKEYGEVITGSSEVAKIIEEKLVMPIDALDNGVNIFEEIYEGVRPYTISDYLYSYWVDGNTKEDYLAEIFARVSNMARDILKREIEKATRIIEESKIVESIYEQTEDKRIIILDKHYAWGKVLVEKPEPLVVIFENPDTKLWYAKMVKVSSHSFESRKDFPAAWAGKTGEDLAEVSGVADAVFCHNGLFIATAKSKEGALKLAEIALNA